MLVLSQPIDKKLKLCHTFWVVHSNGVYTQRDDDESQFGKRSAFGDVQLLNATLIGLLHDKSGKVKMVVPIPEGCKPWYARTMAQCSDGRSRIVQYKIGYTQGDTTPLEVTIPADPS